MKEVSYSIVSNQAKCLSCEESIFSMHRHHMASCKCGNLTVDGGNSYFRCSHSSPIQGQYISMEDEALSKFVGNIKQAMDTGRNPLGVAYAALRSIRDNNLVMEQVDTGLQKWHTKGDSNE